MSGGFLITHLPDDNLQFRDLVSDDAPGDLRQLHFQGNLSHTTPLQTQKQVPEDVINIVPGKTLPEERECGLRVLPTVASRLMERL